MPTFDLSHPPRKPRVSRLPLPPGARRRAVLLLGVAVPGTLAVGLLALTGGDGPADAALGPTTTVGTRDLATSLEAWGTLERSSEHTVAYAGALVADGTATPPGGDTGPEDDNRAFAGTGGTSSTSSSSTSSSSSSTSSSSSSSSSTSSTTTSCPGSSTTSSSSTSSTSAPPCSSTTSSSTTSSTTSTTRPPTSSTSTPGPAPGGGDGGREGTGGDQGGDAPGGGAADDLAATDGNGRSLGGPTGSDQGPLDGSGADDGDGSDGEGEEVSAVLTGVLDVGATADRGTVLYTADNQPVVALIGDLPAWRTLESGIDDGADVRQLEENLVALGYGAGIEVDESFTSQTAAAVEDWEADLGRADPDGAVEVGDIVFLAAPGDVLGHDAEVGDTVEPGTPVLTIGTEQRIVVAEVDATEAGGWTAGSTVELEWADDSTSTGTVFGVGTEVTDGRVDVVVALGGDDGGGDDGGETGDAAGDRRTGSEAAVTLEDARREGAVAVPVSALVEHDGGPAVRVARSDGPDEVVPVETGLVADGWVEITAGLDGGEEVRLPG